MKMGLVARMRASVLLCAVLFLGVLLAPQQAFAMAAHEKHIAQAVELLQKMQLEQDASSMAHMIASCEGVAIFPSMIATALGVVGSMRGEGLVLVRNPAGGWYGPSFTSILGGMVGLQLGVKSVGLVLVIANKDGLSAFTGGNSFKLGGDVSIAAGPVGRDAEAATDGTMTASIYSYSMSKGLFAGLSASGSVINQNRDANKAYWGKKVEAPVALTRPASAPKIKALVDELNKLEKMAP